MEGHEGVVQEHLTWLKKIAATGHLLWCSAAAVFFCEMRIFIILPLSGANLFEQQILNEVYYFHFA